jgi:hypothetical protein
MTVVGQTTSSSIRLQESCQGRSAKRREGEREIDRPNIMKGFETEGARSYYSMPVRTAVLAGLTIVSMRP